MLCQPGHHTPCTRTILLVVSSRYHVLRRLHVYIISRPLLQLRIQIIAAKAHKGNDRYTAHFAVAPDVVLQALDPWRITLVKVGDPRDPKRFTPSSSS